MPELSTLPRYRRIVGAFARRSRDRPTKTESQPPAPPPGWVVGPPDFVGVGTARSGTSWWNELIHAHPQVARTGGVPKEIHYFDRFWQGDFSDSDVAPYHAFFPRPVGSKAGEWTPGYMLDFWTPPLLRQAAPDARLLVLLRDPVERYRSGLTPSEDRMTLAWAARASANGGYQRGIYADQLQRLWAAFPRQQVLVLQYERCVRDARGELGRTFTFLGLDPAPAQSLDVERQVNEAKVRTVPLSSWQRGVLARRYAPENLRLADLVPDLDLSLWTAP